jgi:hypothetical protein
MIEMDINFLESIDSEKSGKPFVDPEDFGFSTEATGIENARALQKALDAGGTIIVSSPGTYKLAKTVYIGGYTSLIFGNNVFIQKVDEQGPFSHVILNRGALTKTYDEQITIENLYIIVNGVDVRKFEVFGLHGQIAFFYIRDLKIEGFRCMDLGKLQYGIHVCTFEDVIINNVIIKGDKDGVHLGRGKRFLISNGIFETFDDAVALNAHDYDVGNPELGWIEDGIVENCHDLDEEKSTGFFCRILAGAWIDWKPGMEVQKSDTVVSNGRLYRVKADPDGTIYISKTQPMHSNGAMVLDGINWVVVQDDETYTAGVRNVIFRNIFLRKPRIGFSVHFDNDKYSRSYYPGAQSPAQKQLTFDNIRILHDKKIAFLSIGTPMDVLTISNSSLRNNSIIFHSNKAMTDYYKTKINIFGCVFNQKGNMDLVVNDVDNKEIELKTSSNIELHDDFVASVISGQGRITVHSDLKGLRKD